jgi:hypothetical protein
MDLPGLSTLNRPHLRNLPGLENRWAGPGVGWGIGGSVGTGLVTKGRTYVRGFKVGGGSLNGDGRAES